MKAWNSVGIAQILVSVYFFQQRPQLLLPESVLDFGLSRRKSDVPVRPAFTGVRHGKHETFRFYTKNGMQIRIYRSGEFEQYLNERRFYEKKQLPRLARLSERKGLLFTVTASNDFLKKNVEKQRSAAMMSVIREIENYFSGAVRCSTYDAYPEGIWL